MADLFKEIIPAILQTKKNVLITDQDIKDYTPFIVNRALSYHMDCILYANQINMNHFIDKDMQNQYLLNTIRPVKRKFQSWAKKDNIKDIESIKEYFGYSNEKAKQALRILSPDEITYIKEKTNKKWKTL